MQVWTFAKEISDFINTAKSVVNFVLSSSFCSLLDDEIFKFSVLYQETEISYTLLST